MEKQTDARRTERVSRTFSSRTLLIICAMSAAISAGLNKLTQGFVCNDASNPIVWSVGSVRSLHWEGFDSHALRGRIHAQLPRDLAESQAISVSLVGDGVGRRDVSVAYSRYYVLKLKNWWIGRDYEDVRAVELEDQVVASIRDAFKIERLLNGTVAE